ncbi:hypothetical protein Pcinc_040069 [Petrolisthes cinctipes]|uniref:Uncharacterized protein n=1 Tax=Petrolisthes cinctipes TaxID=88211 RepID=A0AAE1BQZ2_PETCI|nr:hypothetical protein Pcinc_040069 [Petrolisthes cinctipes]
MPQSPISRTEGGSVSAIKHFLFGGALDTSRQHHQEQDGGGGGGSGSGGETKPPLRSNIFRGQILRAQIFKPQIIKSQIIKTRIQRSSEFSSGSCESDANFPNNLRTTTTMTITSSHNSSRSQLPKLNNLSSNSFRHVQKPPLLRPEDKECPQYTSSPNLSAEPSTTAMVSGSVVSVTFASGTLPRNFQAKSARTKTLEKCNNVGPSIVSPSLPLQSSSPPSSSLPQPSSSVPLQSSLSSSPVSLPSSSLSSLPLPSSSSSSECSSYAQGSNTTFDSGFLSDSTCQDSEALDPPSSHQGSKQPSEPAPQVRVTLHQDNPTYGCLPPHRNPSSTPNEATPKQKSSRHMAEPPPNQDTSRYPKEPPPSQDSSRYPKEPPPNPDSSQYPKEPPPNQDSSRYPKEPPPNQDSSRQAKEAPPPPRKPGRQVSSVILKIENGLFATASSKDTKSPREGRGRDRRPLDPSSTPPLPPPPSCIIVKEEVPEQKKEEEVEEAEGGEEWKRATVTTSGAFLARCVKIEDFPSFFTPPFHFHLLPIPSTSSNFQLSLPLPPPPPPSLSPLPPSSSSFSNPPFHFHLSTLPSTLSIRYPSLPPPPASIS